MGALCSTLLACGGSWGAPVDAGASDAGDAAADANGADASSLQQLEGGPSDAAPSLDVQVCDASALSVTSVAPSFVACLHDTAFTIAGAGFVPGAKVLFLQSGTPIATLANAVVSPTQITGTFPGSGPPVGSLDVVVVNPDGCGAGRAGAVQMFCEK